MQQRIAIMQPYFFPYLGYFQLIASVDRFVSYEDVNFIKQGWISRNRLLVNGKPFLFTLPLLAVSSFKKINEIEINYAVYPKWQQKFSRTLEFNYSRAPFFAETFSLVGKCLTVEALNVADFNVQILKIISYNLGINTDFKGSTSYGNTSLTAQERVIDICKKESATQYINPAGGAGLYSKEDFRTQGIDLRFFQPILREYKQEGCFDFVSGLSIIDVLMNLGSKKTAALLSEYALI